VDVTPTEAGATGNGQVTERLVGINGIRLNVVQMAAKEDE